MTIVVRWGEVREEEEEEMEEEGQMLVGWD